ncbi:MAG: DUF167 family protein [Nitrososphaerota archaeon]|jgi:uncharacterized protein (TIGR00251 family)|nr:DUF167 family protein [Nitrososphaerota archaeon]
MSSIKEVADGILITIFVKPNSSKFSISLNNEKIIVCATKEPEKGKVNREILKELSRLCHFKVELISGATSRQKQLKIVGATKTAIEQYFKENETTIF